jgi:hypothetical protein
MADICWMWTRAWNTLREEWIPGPGLGPSEREVNHVLRHVVPDHSSLGDLHMKCKFCTAIIAILLCTLPLTTFSGAEQSESETYYGRLKSLLTRRNIFRVRPKTSERDVNLIEIEKGAGGVLFGASMDDVVAVWGKPSGLFIDGIRPTWELSIGACEFGFIDNRLVQISLHSATLKTAHLANGIGFDSSYDEVKSAFGEPLEATYSHLEFATKNGYVIDFHFLPDRLSEGKRKIVSITIFHPDSGQ